MPNLWLDDLSEDWPVQDEISLQKSRPSMASSTHSAASQARGTQNTRNSVSRIPLQHDFRSNGKRRHSIVPLRYDSDSLPLSERNANPSNPKSSRRASPSTTSRNGKHNSHGRNLSRIPSTSSVAYGSVVRNTPLQKSLSSSPIKGGTRGATPEWKRALKQPLDLLSTGAPTFLGLFQPPKELDGKDDMSPDQSDCYHDSSVMPSSPPLLLETELRADREDREFERGDKRSPPRNKARMIQYRLVEQEADQSSFNDLSQSSYIRPSASLNRSSQSQQPIIHNDMENNMLCEVSISSHREDSPPHDSSLLDVGGPRHISSQSDSRHEGLSPIYITRHDTSNGDVSYAPVSSAISGKQDASAQDDVEDMVDELLESSFIIKDEDDYETVYAHGDENTDDYAHNGRFVQVGRGSPENDASFPLVESLKTSSMQGQVLTLNTENDNTVTNEPNNDSNVHHKAVHEMQPRVDSANYSQTSDAIEKDTSPGSRPSTARPSSGASPLKLFGAYDTFTTHKLQRTLSNIECNMASESTSVNSHSQSDDLPEQANEGSPPTSIIHNSSSRQLSLAMPRSRNTSMQLNKFGQGELDNFAFGDLSDSNLYSELDHNSSSIQGNPSPQGGMFKFHIDNGTLNRNSLPKRRMRVVNSSDQRLVRPRIARNTSIPINVGSVDIHISKRTEVFTTPRKELVSSQILQSPYSPIKDPTPKRRRTLHKGDIEYQNRGSGVEIATQSLQRTQTVIGKKRKDVRQGTAQKVSDSKILATRAISTPQRMGSARFKSRIKTPNHLSRDMHQSLHLVDTESQHKLACIQAELDDVLPAMVSMTNDRRQPSVNTSDFLNDAVNVMAALRQMAQKPELNQINKNYVDEDDSIQESTMEPFSRPASRTGAPLIRPAHSEQNPDHLSHLQKFQDTNDLDNLIFSMKSCDLDNDRTQAHKTSLPPHSTSVASNIKMSREHDSPRKRKYSSSSAPQVPSFTDGDSWRSASDPSTNRTGTSSFRLGENVKVIAADKVSHLIPEHLKGMVYDRERNAWLKEKRLGEPKDTQLDETEVDPFENIPDLTIDETRERERLFSTRAQRKDDVVHEGFAGHNEGHGPVTISSISGHNQLIVDDVNTTKRPEPENIDFVKYMPAFHSTGSNPHNVYTNTKAIELDGISKATDTNTGPINQRISQDSSALRDDSTERSAYRRKVTISFSSPIASIIEPVISTGNVERLVDQGSAHKHIISSMKRPTKNRNHVFSADASPSKDSARMAIYSDMRFVSRPVSRIDEQDEESFLERMENQARDHDESLMVTPAPQRTISQALSCIVETPTVSAVQDSMLNLTPLSDFTIRQKDTSFVFEASMLEGSSRDKKSRNVKGKSRSMSLSINNLVKNITDVEQHEPYWEHMKVLNLKSRRLQALHMLNEFCPNLEEFDVADNEVHHLDGMPPLLRRLDVSHNILSDLTSWNTLRNLQYVDVSNNDLRSLTGFKELVHLRYLKADNNKITSLDGILHLDGLIELRLRGNAVEQVDFINCNLPRLLSLDLKGNRLQSILNLTKVPSLVNVNLEDNKIREIPSGDRYTVCRLKYLKLSGNQIEELDLSNFTNLRILYLDRNRVRSIRELRSVRHLDSLSLREQHPETSLSTTILDEASEVRKLFLSGNYLGTFSPNQPYLNLQYLELANCGITDLPADFQTKLPNLRILNINFNAIVSLKPLIGLTRLKTLHASGNRLSQLRQATHQLQKLQALTMLDLRNNPMTLGFYQPHCEKRLSYEERHEEIGKVEPWTMEDGNRNKDIAWEKRLDLGTAIERRTYELKIVGSCSSLQMLDGLIIHQQDLCRKDRVSLRMAEEGLLVFADDRIGNSEISREQSGTTNDVTAPSTPQLTKSCSVMNEIDTGFETWAFEDSFA